MSGGSSKDSALAVQGPYRLWAVRRWQVRRSHRHRRQGSALPRHRRSAQPPGSLLRHSLRAIRVMGMECVPATATVTLLTAVQAVQCNLLTTCMAERPNVTKTRRRMAATAGALQAVQQTS